MATYTMSEIVEIVGLTASTLRYYESEKLIPKVKRNSSGRRYYSDTDVQWILFIKALRNTEMPIEQIKKYVLLFKQGNETIHERKMFIEAHTNKVEKEIEEKVNNLETLKKKLKYYELMDKRKQRLNRRAFDQT
ncbi:MULTISPECIES: MerR family transcriptional regulator [Shouchella]|uniref:MerR family transcriptional regulator n=2 Tax=Shouchella TaxID=2893057 RepID=A0ABY7W9T7_9BACI|nr:MULTISPECIES: MerR family transcriptional regulator [Shouchella]MED4129132.1 MerR family transcriptional regulator [Shouchella miscanthi]WDF05675.1 MerR family transcriptional regulator [Shouchella hunanensis]